MDIHRSSGDRNYILRVRDGQGVFEFRNRTFNCLNASNPGIGALMELRNTNTAEIGVGSATNARMGVGCSSSVRLSFNSRRNKSIWMGAYQSTFDSCR